MFEAYTEKARRCVFFARYEAFVTRVIEVTPEHLLLGLLREAQDFVEVIAPGVTEAEIRSKIQLRSGEELDLQWKELPLNAFVRRSLSLALEEAERMGHPDVGCKHLLLGISQLKASPAAETLTGHGFDIDRARMDAGQNPLVWGEEATPEIPSPVVREWLGTFHWERRLCQARDALICRDDQLPFLYQGEKIDLARFVLAQDSWTHYHCAFCWADLFEGGNPRRSECYTNGQTWICPSCYERFRGLPEDAIYDGDY